MSSTSCSCPCKYMSMTAAILSYQPSQLHVTHTAVAVAAAVQSLTRRRSVGRRPISQSRSRVSFVRRRAAPPADRCAHNRPTSRVSVPPRPAQRKPLSYWAWLAAVGPAADSPASPRPAPGPPPRPRRPEANDLGLHRSRPPSGAESGSPGRWADHCRALPRSEQGGLRQPAGRHRGEDVTRAAIQRKSYGRALAPGKGKGRERS